MNTTKFEKKKSKRNQKAVKLVKWVGYIALHYITLKLFMVPLYMVYRTVATGNSY